MRFKLLILLCVAMVFVSSACAGQQDSAKTPGNTTGRDTIPGTTEKRQEIPPIASPEIGISDSREHQNGGWLVTIAEEAGHVYRVSNDNDVWVKFSFSERMDEADVLAHLVVEPAVCRSLAGRKAGTRDPPAGL